jgi:hypothetical protein
MPSYTFPAELNKPTQAAFSREESPRFDTSQPASGPYYVRIMQDDSPVFFNVSFLFDQDDALAFRAFVRQDNFALLNGAEFNINIPLESGTVAQVASFTPDGAPQLDGLRVINAPYTCRIMVLRPV